MLLAWVYGLLDVPLGTAVTLGQWPCCKQMGEELWRRCQEVNTDELSCATCRDHTLFHCLREGVVEMYWKRGKKDRSSSQGLQDILKYLYRKLKYLPRLLKFVLGGIIPSHFVWVTRNRIR